MIASIIKVTWLPWAQQCAAFTLFERSYGSWHIVLFTLRFLLHDKQADYLLFCWKLLQFVTASNNFL